MNGTGYEALDVANYIVNFSINEGTPISNLKLQKLLYYVQAASLVENNGQPMFEDDICAWTYGPVVEQVYHEFKSYANMTIDDYVVGKVTDYGFGYNDEYEPEKIIDKRDGSMIQRIVKSYQRVSPLAMVRKTHEEEPWKEAHRKNETIISIEAIRDYYLKNRGLIYGAE